MTTVGKQMVSPGEAFYRIFSAAQVETIIEALDKHAEFPLELTYVGAEEYWRDGEKMTRPEMEQVAHNARELISQYAERLIGLLPAEAPVDVVEFGPGNSQPVHGLLRRLVAAGRFNGYRAIDISPAMLGIARDRLHAAFPDHVARIRLYAGDFTGPAMAQVLPGRRGDEPVRMMVMAGNTLYNLAEPDAMLQHIRSVTSPGDLLVVVLRIDTIANRPPFMDRVRVGHRPSPQKRLGLDLLNLDPSWYVAETGFDPVRSEIFVRARFTRPIVLNFGRRGTVSFDDGDSVLLFRLLFHDRQALIDQFIRTGFTIQLLEAGPDGEMVIVAACADSE